MVMYSDINSGVKVTWEKEVVAGVSTVAGAGHLEEAEANEVHRQQMQTGTLKTPGRRTASLSPVPGSWSAASLLSLGFGRRPTCFP